jgi:hypothetical protein
LATATAPTSGPTAARDGERPSEGVLSTCPSPASGSDARPNCQHCGRFIPHPLRRCRRRQCPGYASIWAGDQRQKLFGNLNAYADQVPAGIKAPRVLVSAATAPGVGGGMEWDEHHCADLGPHEHSGKLGCRVRHSQSARWNESAPARWRELHGEAYRRCVREGLKPWLLVRVWEMQKRGLLHAHPVLAYSTPRERAGADRYLEHLDALRGRYGFGFIERKQRVRDPRAAAAYLSSYFINGKGNKISLEESVQSNWLPRSIIHVSAALTQRSRITMRTLRLRRYAWVLWRESDSAIWSITGLEPQDLWYGLREGVALTELVASALDNRGFLVEASWIG